MRNPYDWYVSMYETEHWKYHQREGSEMTDPDMSFGDYLKMATAGKDWSMMIFDHKGMSSTYWNPSYGCMGSHLAWFLSEGHPGGYVSFAKCDVLRFEEIRHDLRNWLRRHGFSDERHYTPPMMVSKKREDREWEAYYEPWMIQMVRGREPLAFVIYEEGIMQ
jgi:hypothetical protein